MSILLMCTAFVDCVLASLCGQNSTSDFAADEGWDSKTQIELVHGACWQRSRETASSVRRRRHSYNDISAQVHVQRDSSVVLDISWTFHVGKPFEQNFCRAGNLPVKDINSIPNPKRTPFASLSTSSHSLPFLSPFSPPFFFLPVCCLASDGTNSYGMMMYGG